MSHSDHGVSQECESDPSSWLEPAKRVNDVAVDHHFEVEVAARGGARGAADRNNVAAGDLLADVDGG